MAPFVLATIVLALTAAPLHPQETQDVEIQTVRVADNVYMLMGRGGNIGVSVGEDGVFLVDDQYAPLTDKILAAVREISDRPIRFVINTHWHGDHTGGNENMGKAGAVIVAHENVRVRMSTEQFLSTFNRRTPPSPPGALPVITFTDAVTFHWNGDSIRVFHVEPAHTDGDAVIHFTKANVIHMGDIYFAGRYPFIDSDAGGTIDGVITAVEAGLRIAASDTKIIPGHGQLSDVEELRDYGRMLSAVRDKVTALIAQGRSRDEVIAAKPSQEFDADWGGGSFQPDQWIGIVYDGLVRK
ncbi:MAG: MBL fold metallo-hydrolase [Gemmatimonadales bacterium]|nr:MBL fold metallo-hydrolase [Gemmatimonadales bacterium]